ncbi:DUF3786 domain-containing protein [Desulfosarcina sp.]|uniref:DUF3786 domain-containing protein n=1 Tax=Desulfosarcina sp. TaxID=2027861 RepID=UPI0035681426
MTELIDIIHFEELSRRDPIDVCRRALCKYDDMNESYTLSAWGDDYRIFPNQLKISCMGNNSQRMHDYFYLFMIHYLLQSRETEPFKEWISEKDIPGGPTFFRGPHEIPTRWISNRFNDNIDEFKARCEQLHGIRLNMADAAYRFRITPRIPAAVLYWLGDENFPAEAKILYDRTIADHLAADIVYALAVAICERIGRHRG